MKLPLLLSLLLLTACSVNNQVPMAEYQQGLAKLPPVTVFFKRPDDDFRQACESFDRGSLLDHCYLNQLNLEKFYSELKAADVFENVLYANKDVGYQLLLSTARYHDEDAEELGSAVTAGLTLMIAPMIMTQHIKVNVALNWYGYALQQFEYELPLELRVSILNTQQDMERDIAKSIASHLLNDIQKGDYFSAAYLAQALQSSDYEAELQTPEVASNYQRDSIGYYHHPFQGAQLRYIHQSNNMDYIDVFVYPVRSPYWEQERKDLLAKEADHVKKDIELTHKELEFSDTAFNNYQFRRLPLAGGELELVYFENEYIDLLQNNNASKTYIMMLGDKFIKVRHTAIKGYSQQEEVDNFVTQLLNATKVPQESVFMAKLRKQWRDQGSL
ncbi:hypothetical protein NO559_11715 [Dasania sp. GY-MA-18]|uniref:Uncharacterized protein n=1 Tax=Dasania phycosphaerae TaxID=2950436 RepID=A0A9J6RMC8_9GAMM|nr:MULTISPECIES: hypothetical protein [Dasania]MCR8923445.1 hypothetical protein [Dasania sp. GY-MA-18]MCZ0865878.1 hypothetical protein [Dasania phycosphaerae]MCZ0869602.1 hypothetical protein [Dasania phycosphaerae]